MSGDGEDTIGCIVGAVVIIGGAWWLFSNYEVKKRIPDAPAPVISTPVAPPVPRPTGNITVTATKSGSLWILDANSVSGSRKARQGWVTVDASKDKTEDYRESKTLYLVDCDTSATRVLSVAKYGAGVTPTYSESHDPKDAKVDYYPPNTLGGSVVHNICDPVFDR